MFSARIYLKNQNCLISIRRNNKLPITVPDRSDNFEPEDASSPENVTCTSNHACDPQVTGDLNSIGKSLLG